MVGRAAARDRHAVNLRLGQGQQTSRPPEHATDAIATYSYRRTVPMDRNSGGFKRAPQNRSQYRYGDSNPGFRRERAAS